MGSRFRGNDERKNPHNSRMTPRSPATAFGAAKKQLGQHFLVDRSYIEKIVLAVDPRPGDRLVEIGPGQGAITFPLLDRHGELTVIEFDRDLIFPLSEAARAHGTLEVIHRDVLAVDFTALAHNGEPGERLRLVGNLPYNLSSPILFHGLEHAAAIRDMTFMLQAYCDVTPLFDVPPGAFRPPPKVDSAVVRMVPKPAGEIGVQDRRRFEEVVRAAFGQRRKTLRNALAGVCDATRIEAAGLRPDARAEQIEVADFVKLANLPA